MSAGWAGAEALAPAPEQGDACVSGDDGGSDGAWHSGAGIGPRLEPPFAPSVRQPMGGVDDAAWAGDALERILCNGMPAALAERATTADLPTGPRSRVIRSARWHGTQVTLFGVGVVDI